PRLHREGAVGRRRGGSHCVGGNWAMKIDELDRAEEVLGYQFKDRELLRRALRHASCTDNKLDSNERLEFLGDAILGMVICDHLYEQFPQLLEGELTKIKSTVVSRDTCARIAR